jgi:heme-degrading monooxygenase HmoA
MFLEIAQIAVKPGLESDFEARVKQAAPLFQRAKGCKSMSLQRSHELPSRYRLFVQWETLADHQGFCTSADHETWRKLVVHCFAGPPAVEHVTEVVRGF